MHKDNISAPLDDRQARVGAAFSKLTTLLGDRATLSMALRTQHSQGEGVPDAGLPDIVTFAQTTQEVAEIAKICTTHVLPMVPFGAGSSLEGQLAAVEGGVSINLTQMDKVLSVSQASMDCRVEAGLTRMALNRYLRETGLFFPLDPGADATLGGMAATRASGTNAVGYGTMREVCLGLTVVTPDGRIIQTGTRARKSAMGYDLTKLYVGSEGTLGIITELQLRLYGQPDAIICGVCQFDELSGATQTASMALQAGLQMVRIELLDEVQMGACISYSKLDEFRPIPTLFVEFHGTQQATAEQAEMFSEFAAEFGSQGFELAKTTEDRSRLWTARHNAYHAVMALAPGKRNMGTDACVPIEHLAACIEETQADVRQSGLVAPIIGHVGDGNFHLGILFDPQDSQERNRADALADRVSERALRYGGSCSGEHGVGLHKIRYMRAEHGEAVEIMRAIKTALDPLGLMNPGKMIPQTVEHHNENQNR
ncbi:MAG: FAD-binding protein [Rhodobacteraceae bacterium]|nr:FAD-binding protein [Paracoccaceae bacterium]PHR56232.1 MAG: 2-hydroxy-acid oxidase [Robiginitomaculum sp.]